MRHPKTEDAERAMKIMEETGCYAYEAAEQIGVDNSALSKMLKSDLFSERYATTKRRAAQRQESLALAALDAIGPDDTKADVARQLAKAQHFWKAARVRDNKRYGEQVQVSVEHKVDLIGAIEEGKRRALSIIEGRATEIVDAALTFDACENTEIPGLLP